MASKLDKALSLTKLSKLSKSSCKFIEGSSGKSRASSGSRVPMLTDLDMRVKMGKSSLSKDLSIFHKSSKGGKSKMAAKTKPSDPCLKGKGQRKTPYSPMRSEISSFSNSKSDFFLDVFCCCCCCQCFISHVNRLLEPQGHFLLNVLGFFFVFGNKLLYTITVFITI